jgi:hypothetical protein
MTAPRPPSVPLAPVLGVLRLVVNQQLAGVKVINVLHAKQAGGGPWSQADADSYVTAFRQAWFINIAALQQGAMELHEVTGTDLTSPVGVVATAPGNTMGGAAGVVLPAHAAMTISWPVSTHYRGGHPRTYIGGLPSSAQATANSWSASAATAMQTNAGNFRTTMNAAVNSAGAVALVAVHRVRARARLTVPTTEPLGPPRVDSGIDSQRRRLGKI